MKKWRPGLYKSANEHLTDVLKANTNVTVKHVVLKDGVREVATRDYERAIALKEQAAAITRLTVDAAMTK